MSLKGNLFGWSPYVKSYDPLKAGSIDGTDLVPHDNAIVRASCAKYNPPDESVITSDPKHTLFVGRLNLRTDKQQLEKEFSQYGPVRSCSVVRDVVTGMSRGYGFVEFKRETDAHTAWKHAHLSAFHERQIIVEWEFARTMPGWIPRRLGGGLGGKKESGQLRFGGRDRPFRKPLILPVDQEPSEPLPESAKADKPPNPYQDTHKDVFSSREGNFKGSNSKYYRPNSNERGSWARDSFEKDRRKSKRYREEEISEQYYYGRNGGDARGEVSHQKYSRKQYNDCWESDNFWSEKFSNYNSSHYEESKESKYSKDDRKLKSSHEERKYDRYTYDTPHRSKESPHRKSKSGARKHVSDDSKADNKEPLKKRHKRDYSPDNQAYELKTKEGAKVSKRISSPESTSSCKSSSRKKHKKKKKHKKHKKHSGNSDSSFESESTKVSKRKKKKSRKRHSSKDSDS